MPLKNYGVWKATPISFDAERAHEDPDSPHGHLFFQDGISTRELSSAINLKSLSDDSRLVYWLTDDFEHPIQGRLERLEKGWHDIGLGSGTDPERYSLDLLRDNLVELKAGRVVPHDVVGNNNDIIDYMEPFFQNAISKRATVYIFGEQYNGKDGVHDVHMNQGSGGRFTSQNGTHQDGGVIVQFADGHWEAFFIAFASQAVKTLENGDADGEVFSKFLGAPPTDGPPDGGSGGGREEPAPRPTGPVSIVAAIVNPEGRDNIDNPEKVFLQNTTDADVSIEGWKIENKLGESHRLSGTAVLAAAGAQQGFEVTGVALSNKGGSITLKDGEGKVVDKVSYTKEQARAVPGELIYFP